MLLNLVRRLALFSEQEVGEDREDLGERGIRGRSGTLKFGNQPCGGQERGAGGTDKAKEKTP
jgi:hypothetical protein